MKTIELTGNDYEIGYKIGEQFREPLQLFSKRFKEMFENNEEVRKDVNYQINLIKEIYPNSLEEIYGRADGAKISREVYMLLSCPEIYKGRDGCTTLMLKKRNSTLFAHNEDGAYTRYNTVALARYNYPDFWSVNYTVMNKLSGSAFGFNCYNLVFSQNFINENDINLKNVSRYFATHDIIFSKSIDEAIKKAKEVDIASGYSMNIVDKNTNESVNIEKDNHNVYVKEITDRFARSNHYIQREDFVKNESSIFRLEKGTELINKLDLDDAKIEDLLKILRYQGDDYVHSIFRDYDKYKDSPRTSRTSATFLVDTNSNNIIIYDYIEKEKIICSWNGKISSKQSMMDLHN